MMPSATPRTRDFREMPAPERESDVLRRALLTLSDHLPSGWTATGQEQYPTPSNRQIDMVVDVMAPDGESVRFVVEAKRSIVPKDVDTVLGQLAAYARDLE